MQEGGLQDEIAGMADRIVVQVRRPAVLEGDRPGPDHPGPGENAVDSGTFFAAEQMPVGVVGEHRERCLTAVDLGVKRSEHHHVAPGYGVDHRVHQGLATRLEQMLGQEEPEDDVDRPAAQPDPAAAHLELRDMASMRVEPAGTPAPGDRVQEGCYPAVVVGPVRHRDHRERAALESGLLEDQADVLAQRVDEAQPVLAGEVAEHRVADHGLAELAVLDAVHRAAHVQLKQAQAGRVWVHVGPGQLGDVRCPGAQRRLDLIIGQACGPGERGEVAAVQPVGQADHRGPQVLEIGVQQAALGVADEQRAGEVPLPRDRPQHAGGGDDRTQVAGRGSVPRHCVKVASGQRGPVRHRPASYRVRLGRQAAAEMRAAVQVEHGRPGLGRAASGEDAAEPTDASVYPPHHDPSGRLTAVAGEQFGHGPDPAVDHVRAAERFGELIAISISGSPGPI
jgi:hypothetical protein